MSSKIDEVVRGLYAAAAETVAEGDEVHPVWLTIPADPGGAARLAVFAEFPPDAGPEAVGAMTRAAVADPEVAAVVFMNEAWVVQRDPRSELLEGRVADQPDREETVLLLVTTRAGTEAYSWPIRRSAAGASVEWRDALKGAKLGGRLVPGQKGNELH